MLTYEGTTIKVKYCYVGDECEAKVCVRDPKNRLEIESLEEVRQYDKLIEETFQAFVQEVDEYGDYRDTCFYAYVTDTNVPQEFHINTLRRSHTCSCWYGISGYKNHGVNGVKTLFAHMVIIPIKK